MRCVRSFAFIALLALACALLGAQQPAPSQPSALPASPAAQAPAAPFVQQPLVGQLVLEHLHSVALEHNLLGDSADRSFYVYLPPSYATSPKRRYPVVYFLHGYSGTARLSSIFFSAPVDAAFAKDNTREMIVVFPDGKNRLLGSFYVDSAATGNWEQHIAREIVGFVDGKYRTVARAESRGIAGHSMGGNGALHLAMRHPEIFSVVYALSPCCMNWANDFSLTNPAWHGTLAMASLEDFAKAPFLSKAFAAIAAAWSPDPGRPPFYAAYPVRDVNGELVPERAAEAQWSANLPVVMADAYAKNLRQLSGIGFDVGRQDEFAHILTGARQFDEVLGRKGIRHQFEEYEGDHANHVQERLERRALPFFAAKLKFPRGQ